MIQWWNNLNFLTPAAGIVAASITVPALVLLYFLKLRRQRMAVSSTLLWRKSIEDLQVNSPFQRIRRNLLLLLQLIVLVGLLIAIARPTTRAVARPGQRVVIAIDHSASMNAIDVTPSRLDVAKDRALELIAELDASSPVMIISFAHQARVMQSFTRDRALLRAAIRSIDPTDQQSRLGAALQLVEPWSIRERSDAGKELVIHVVSDGRIHDNERLAIEGSELFLEQIGRSPDKGGARNVGIVSIAARRDFKDPNRVQVYVRLTNYGFESEDATVTLSIDGEVPVGGIKALSVPRTRPSDVAEGAGNGGQSLEDLPGVVPISFEFAHRGSALIKVSHDVEDDLDADNRAYLNLTAPDEFRVLVVTRGNVFLAKIVEAVARRSPRLMAPLTFEQQRPDRDQRFKVGDAERYDLIIFDSYSPKETPEINSVYFGCAPPISGLRSIATTENEPKSQVILDWHRDHPLMRWVTLDDVVLVEPGRLSLPDNARVLATGEVGPVMADVMNGSVHHVVASFGLLNSNWPMQISFAVFMDNLAQTLGALGSDGISYQPGDVVVVEPVTDSTAKSISYSGPVPVSARVEAGRAVLPVFQRTGLFDADQPLASPWDRIAVNLTDVIESDTRLPRQLKIAATAVTAAGDSVTMRLETWRWFILAALGVLMIEWVVYTRRMHI